MPHCIIEYSLESEKSVEPSHLMNAVYQGALRSQLFSDDDIKSRTIAFENYQSGPVKKAFVHVTVKILSGRTRAQRSMLSHSIVSELENLHSRPVSLTVEVVEMEKESYAKVLL